MRGNFTEETGIENDDEGDASSPSDEDSTHFCEERDPHCDMTNDLVEEKSPSLLASSQSNNTNNPPRRRKLGVVPLAILIFYGVSGGAFGVEETVRSAGHFYTLLGFLVMPLVWSVPAALVTAELGSSFPETSGFVAWVKFAFGDCAGWMAAYLGWIAAAIDNAIGPVLFVNYLFEFEQNQRIAALGPWFKFALYTVISCALAYTNWIGLELMGKMSITVCLVAVSPFIIMSIIGIFQVDSTRWFTPPEVVAVDDDDYPGFGLFSWVALENIAWRPYLNNLFWNLNSFDNAATFSASVQDPGRVLPEALGWSVLMVSSCYFLFLLVALGASDAAQHEWVDGYLTVAATQIAGPWLGAWLIVAFGISSIAIFQSALSNDALQLTSVAERGYLPRVFAARSPRYGTPTYALLLETIVIVTLTYIADLDLLIEMLNFNYAISSIMEYLTFIKLRKKEDKGQENSFRIPLGTMGIMLLFTPTIIAIWPFWHWLHRKHICSIPL